MGVGEQNVKVQGEQNVNMQDDVRTVTMQPVTKSNSFGPWIQVSYNRTGRNNMVLLYAGRRNGTSIYFGKIGNGNQNVSGTSRYEAGKTGNDGEGRIESVKGVEGIDSRKVVAEKMGVKIGVKKVGDSRFSVLSEGMEE